MAPLGYTTCPLPRPLLLLLLLLLYLPLSLSLSLSLCLCLSLRLSPSLFPRSPVYVCSAHLYRRPCLRSCVPGPLSREAGLVLLQGCLLVSRTLLTDYISRVEGYCGKSITSLVRCVMCLLPDVTCVFSLM